ncbi:MAG: hypothetical protein LBQ67_04510 [Treponema sp.]|jgi:hypothetical protein|nr:hypothetical protein [Treponema sp.]
MRKQQQVTGFQNQAVRQDLDLKTAVLNFKYTRNIRRLHGSLFGGFPKTSVLGKALCIEEG